MVCNDRNKYILFCLRVLSKGVIYVCKSLIFPYCIGRAASIFGAARPVDTAAREREIEERLNKQKELEKERIEQEREKRLRYTKLIVFFLNWFFFSK